MRAFNVNAFYVLVEGHVNALLTVQCDGTFIVVVKKIFNAFNSEDINEKNTNNERGQYFYLTSFMLSI